MCNVMVIYINHDIALICRLCTYFTSGVFLSNDKAECVQSRQNRESLVRIKNDQADHHKHLDVPTICTERFKYAFHSVGEGVQEHCYMIIGKGCGNYGFQEEAYHGWTEVTTPEWNCPVPGAVIYDVFALLRIIEWPTHETLHEAWGSEHPARALVHHGNKTAWNPWSHGSQISWSCSLFPYLAGAKPQAVDNVWIGSQMCH